MSDNTTPVAEPGYSALIDLGIVHVCLEESTEKAAQAILDQADTMPDGMFHALMKLGAQRVAQLAASQVRNKLSKASWSVPSTAGDNVAARLKINGSAYDWPLPGGASIGNATVADLDKAMELHKAIIAGNKRRHDFYFRVQAKLIASGAKTVREGLSETELAEIERNA